MTAETGPAESPVTEPDEWHHLLLRLAGLLPDDVITDARAWLAEGTVDEMAALIAFTALGVRAPLWDQDALMLLDEMARSGHELQPLADLLVTDGSENDDGRWAFAPVRVDDAEQAGTVPLVLDLTAAEMEDAVDQAAVRAASVEAGVVALWRAWRVPADARARLDPPSAEPRRVFLATVQIPSEDEFAVAARIQNALIDAGESNPQVEVWPDGGNLPGYQSAAWLRSALLWTREPMPTIRVARSFDVVDEQNGPGFTPDHPMLLDSDEIERLLDYLAGAPAAMATESTMPDVLDPDAEQEVPLTLRTDGVWVWSDTVPYYLQRHGLSPDPELIAHLEGVADPYPQVSSVALHRVWSYLLAQQ